MSKWLKRIGIGLVALLIVLQLVPLSRTNPPVTREVKWDSPETKALAQRPVAPEEALRFFSDLLAQPLDEENIILTKPVQRLHELYQGVGMGSELTSSRNTAWGLVNAVTEAAKESDTIQRRVEMQTIGGRLLPESRMPMLPMAA